MHTSCIEIIFYTYAYIPAWLVLCSCASYMLIFYLYAHIPAYDSLIMTEIMACELSVQSRWLWHINCPFEWYCYCTMVYVVKLLWYWYVMKRWVFVQAIGYESVLQSQVITYITVTAQNQTSRNDTKPNSLGKPIYKYLIQIIFN